MASKTQITTRDAIVSIRPPPHYARRYIQQPEPPHQRQQQERQRPQDVLPLSSLVSLTLTTAILVTLAFIALAEAEVPELSPLTETFRDEWPTITTLLVVTGKILGNALWCLNFLWPVATVVVFGPVVWMVAVGIWAGVRDGYHGLGGRESAWGLR